MLSVVACLLWCVGVFVVVYLCCCSYGLFHVCGCAMCCGVVDCVLVCVGVVGWCDCVMLVSVLIRFRAVLSSIVLCYELYLICVVVLSFVPLCLCVVLVCFVLVRCYLFCLVVCCLVCVYVLCWCLS